ncbi:MAG: hypothetical protein GY707_12365 [Desulfobacteraceae bacterium]|nr:hypothetical protein [Desulfobacteraceae bacterium]
MKIKTVVLFMLLTFLISTDAYSGCTTTYWNNSLRIDDQAVKAGKEALRKYKYICSWELPATTYIKACSFFVNKAIDFDDGAEYVIMARKKLNRSIDRWEHLRRACDNENSGRAGGNRENLVDYYNAWENKVDEIQKVGDKITEHIECYCSGDSVAKAINNGNFSKEQLKYMPDKVIELAEDYKSKDN